MSRIYLAILSACTLYTLPSFAETRNFAGVRGLNTVPDARFDDPGHVTLTVSHTNPYTHGSLGAQFSDRVYLAIRQTAQEDNPLDDPERLYPGIDTKIKLWDETHLRPQAALGLQSAFGHKQTAGEYLSFSKRWHSFDFTGGIGWGRFGTAGHIDNPLKVISHFDKSRQLVSEQPNGPEDWFTGEKIGFFGGFSYDLPVDGLTFTADWNADRFSAETESNVLDNAPAPWAIGFQYQPYDYMNAGIGLIGTDKLLARVTLQPNLNAWPGRMAKAEKLPHVSARRQENTDLTKAALDASADGRRLSALTEHDVSIHTALSLEQHESTPLQIGRAVRYLMNNSGRNTGSFSVQPRFAGLQGPKIKIARRTLEQSFARQQGSAEEIWRNTEFDHTLSDIPFKGFNHKSLWPEKIILEQQVSVSEIDQGFLYRTGLIVEEQRELLGPFATGGAIRIDLKDNLDQINEFRGRSLLPVRSDIDLFAQRTFSLDHLYLSYLKTPQPNLHFGITGGYLEEQYAGLGGEVLYRPFGKSWALGADAWQVIKRDPLTELNQGFTADSLSTGHLNAWYKPSHNPQILMKASLGRYLAEDLGGTFELSHKFKNGAELEGFVTLTDSSDVSVFGERTQLHHGMRLKLPIGNLDYLPKNSRIDLITSPFGRDTGQSLNKPIDLYDLTEAFSLQHISQHWNDIAP